MQFLKIGGVLKDALLQAQTEPNKPLERVMCLSAQLKRAAEDTTSKLEASEHAAHAEEFKTWAEKQQAAVAKLFTYVDRVKQEEMKVTAASLETKTEALREVCKGAYGGQSWLDNVAKDATLDVLHAEGKKQFLQASFAKVLNGRYKELEKEPANRE